MREFYFQFRYDTEEDASCGTVFCFGAYYLADAEEQAWERVRARGFKKPKLIGTYDHNPTVDEIDKTLDDWKRYKIVHVDESLENVF